MAGLGVELTSDAFAAFLVNADAEISALACEPDSAAKLAKHSSRQVRTLLSTPKSSACAGAEGGKENTGNAGERHLSARKTPRGTHGSCGGGFSWCRLVAK